MIYEANEARKTEDEELNRLYEMKLKSEDVLHMEISYEHNEQKYTYNAHRWMRKCKAVRYFTIRTLLMLIYCMTPNIVSSGVELYCDSTTTNYVVNYNSYEVTNTNSATVNYDSIQLNVEDGNYLEFSTCNSYGDTYLQIYDINNNFIAKDDDNCNYIGCGCGAKITRTVDLEQEYPYSHSNNITWELRLGCYGNTTCTPILIMAGCRYYDDDDDESSETVRNFGAGTIVGIIFGVICGISVLIYISSNKEESKSTTSSSVATTATTEETSISYEELKELKRDKTTLMNKLKQKDEIHKAQVKEAHRQGKEEAEQKADEEARQKKEKQKKEAFTRREAMKEKLYREYVENEKEEESYRKTSHFKDNFQAKQSSDEEARKAERVKQDESRKAEEANQYEARKADEARKAEDEELTRLYDKKFEMEEVLHREKSYDPPDIYEIRRLKNEIEKIISKIKRLGG